MKRILLNVFRTIIAIAVVIIGYKTFYYATQWQSWCPNNTLGTALIIFMYFIGAGGIITGVYAAAPTVWSILLGAALIKVDEGLREYVLNWVDRNQFWFIW